MSDMPFEKKIKHALTAALISGVITFTTSVSMLIKAGTGGLSLLNILSVIDALFIFGMAYGLYKKNRACSVLMFEYFLFSMIFRISISSQINPVSFLTGWMFLYFFYQGITGTYAFHKCKGCEGGDSSFAPLMGILAGSAGQIIYFLVLPGVFLQS